MELKLVPAAKNLFPLGALLIKGPSVQGWLHELQRTGLSLSAVQVYALPGTVAASVWGCLVVGDFEKGKIDAGRAGFCQRVHNWLFIPERAALYPQLSPAEAAKLFDNKFHFMHPEIGLVALEDAVDWTTVIQLPRPAPHAVKKPAASPFVPGGVKSFQVKAVDAEETLAQFAGQFPGGERFGDKPLNPFEKAKLFLYQQFLAKGGNDNSRSGASGKSAGEKLGWLAKLLPKKAAGWMDKLQENFEELERRNQKHLDRLMDLLKKDPAEALKYALPLDADGTGRGGSGGSFNMEKRWFDFSLFGGGWSGGGGAASMSGDSYRRLYEQYSNTAKELIKQKDYRKAAFVYLKLLKDYTRAAQTLEEGGLYSEAAAVYLKYCKDKPKAAECFEKAAQFGAAIDLHKELGNDEKVGDLYLRLSQSKEAFFHYQKVVDGYDANHQYLKASLLLKNKMGNEAAAQECLLKGWRLSRDAFNCLNNYFVNFRDAKALGEAMQNIYGKEVTPANREVFLRVLQHEYGKHSELSQTVKDMAYEIIAAEAATNPSIVSELRTFNKADKQLVKDTMRFKVNAQKR